MYDEVGEGARERWYRDVGSGDVGALGPLQYMSFIPSPSSVQHPPSYCSLGVG
jgi:hypothetical protein